MGELEVEGDRAREVDETVVRAVTRELVARMARDPMIGFFFARADLERLADLEYQHAARALGLPVRYEGRSLEAVHYPKRIFGGQFDRRLVILRGCLERHGLPEPVRARWLEHEASLRDRIVRPGAPDCG